MSNQSPQTPNSKHLLAVSIHDVSPHTWQDTDAILKRLDAIGIANRILLVIPNFRGEHPIDEADPQFIDWLKSCQEKDEICLHGHQHQATEISGGPIARLMATIYTNREGEFYQLNRSEIENKLEDGLQKFKLLGLDSSGFIAPAWLLSPQAVSVLQERALSIQPASDPSTCSTTNRFPDSKPQQCVIVCEARGGGLYPGCGILFWSPGIAIHRFSGCNPSGGYSLPGNIRPIPETDRAGG